MISKTINIENELTKRNKYCSKFLKERKTKQRDLWKEQEDDAREYHDTDYARIIHSASFHS